MFVFIGLTFAAQIQFNTKDLSFNRPLKTCGSASIPLLNDYQEGGTSFVVMTGLEVADDLHQAKQVIKNSLKKSVPVLLFEITSFHRNELLNDVVPLKHVSHTGSSVMLVDTFHDMNHNEHYRFIHLPMETTLRGHSNFVDSFGNTNMTRTSVGTETLFAQVKESIDEYLENCADNQYDQCWEYMSKFQPATDGTMIPEKGAVWREIIETNFRYWKVNSENPFPFHEQSISHRMNCYWYIYLQAPPFSQMYYVIMMTDAMSNPNTKTDNQDASGFYLTNLLISMKVMDAEGKQDPGNIYWIKSSPSTLNTRHTVEDSWSSSDEYHLGLNLGFDAVAGLKFGMHFNYTHTFTASYSEKRDITDWSVVEQTDAVSGDAKWSYYQQWPVDMLRNSVSNFPSNWQQFYSEPWHPCKVKSPPNLSKYAFGNHNSVVWAISPNLRSKDGRQLPIQFRMSAQPTVSAISCHNFDGHHKLFQSSIDIDDGIWEVNVADLNNIQWVD